VSLAFVGCFGGQGSGESVESENESSLQDSLSAEENPQGCY